MTRSRQPARVHRRLRGLASGDGLRGQLVRGGIGSFGIKVVSMSLTVVAAVIVARILGPQGYGVYSYVFVLVSLLAIPAQFGLPALVMRETARAQVRGDWATLKGLWLWAGAVAGGLSVLSVAAGASVAALIAASFSGLELTTFGWGLVLLPAMVLGRVLGGALRGMQHVAAGQVPDLVMRPGLFVGLVLLAVFMSSEGSLTASRVMALHALAGGLALLGGIALLIRVRTFPMDRHAVGHYRHRVWTASLLPLALTASMQLINSQADILMLGLFTDTEQVGIYRIATQAATLVALGLQVVNMVAGPQFARMHARREVRQLQRLATASSRTALLVALPIAMCFVLLGEAFLRAVVGSEYAAGAMPLGILAMGQLAHVGMGSVGLLLNMTEHERVVARGMVVAAVSNVAANLILIPLWGMSGAALATALTFIILNVLLVREVAKRLGIDSTAWGMAQAST